MSQRLQVQRNEAAASVRGGLYCADCGGGPHKPGTLKQQRDGRFTCGKCQQRARDLAARKSQRAFFGETDSLFDTLPNRLEGFLDTGGHFHPIRKSDDYNEFLAGDIKPPKVRKRKPRPKLSEKQKLARRLARGPRVRTRKVDVREGGVDYARRTAKRSRGRAVENLTLSQFVRRTGGIAPDAMYAGELDRLSPKQLGTTGLINRHARAGGHQKRTAEMMMDRANEEGYRDKSGHKWDRVGDFLMAIEADAVGYTKFHHPGREWENPAGKIEYLERPFVIKGEYARAMITKDKGQKFVGQLQPPEGGGYYMVRGRSFTTFGTFDGARKWGRAQIAKFNAAARSQNPVYRKVKVTPEVARRLLKTYAGPKTPIIWARVGKMARQMREGTFVSASPLRVKNKRLTDGRHRLEAVVLSKKAQTFEIETVTGQAKNAAAKSRGVTAQRNGPPAKSRQELEALRERARARLHEALLKVVSNREKAGTGKRITAEQIGKGKRDFLRLRRLVNALDKRLAENPGHVVSAAELARYAARLDADEGEHSKRSWDVTSRRSKTTVRSRAPRHFKVTWYSAKLRKRVGPAQPIEAESGAGAIAEMKIAIGYDDLRRRKQPLPANFLAREVKQNPGLNPKLGEWHKIFQGRDATRVTTNLTARENPGEGWRLGELVYVDIRTPAGNVYRINGEGRAELDASDAAKLYISGLQHAKPDGLNGHGRAVYGVIIELCYLTAKSHINRDRPTQYWHPMGEETGERPRYAVNAYGWPLIVGGAYSIDKRGIIN